MISGWIQHRPQQEHVLASQLRGGGASDADVVEAITLLRQWYDVMRGALSRDEYENAVARARPRTWFAPVANQFELWTEADPYTVWYRGIIDFDPIPLLSRSTTPMLVFAGENDELVSPQRTASDYAALSAAGVPIEFRVVPGVGHDLSARWWFLPRRWKAEYWSELEAWTRAAPWSSD